MPFVMDAAERRTLSPPPSPPPTHPQVSQVFEKETIEAGEPHTSRITFPWMVRT